MSRSALFRNSTTALIICALLATASPAVADKPGGKGGGKGDDHKKRERVDHGRDHDRGDHDRDHGDKGRKKAHFAEHDRTVIRDYYAQEFRAGHCPPGLEKKHNGCMPPGQAKKWGVGRPLPPDVVYYELPQAVTVLLSPPPIGHRYIRVANDILMIAVGTGMVMEAIDDLSR